MTQTALSRSDEWETEIGLFEHLNSKYHLDCKLDVAATVENKKCESCFVYPFDDALTHDWICYYYKRFDVWCNPPHSKTKAFVLKAHEQWLQHNINIMMLVPAGVLCRKYFADIFEKFIETRHGVEWHPVRPRPAFIPPDMGQADRDLKIQSGKLEKARQDYIVIIWRARGK